MRYLTRVFSLTLAFALAGSAWIGSPAQAQAVGASTRTAGAVGTVWQNYDPTSGPTASSASSYYNDTFYVADERASADLATGVLRAYHQQEELALCTCGSTTGSGFAEATLNDILSFQVANATSSTVTLIPFTFSAQGTFATNLAPSSSTAPTIVFSGSLGSAYFVYQYQLGQVQTASGGWNAFAFDLVNPADGILGSQPVSIIGSGAFAITGSSVTGLPFMLDLFLGGNAYTFMDFSHTAYVDLNLPAGVTMTSASGVFLTQPRDDQGPSSVPEPTTWAMMLLGLGVTGSALRRHRKRASAIA